MPDPLSDLTNRGVSIWLDDLSRQRLTTGSLAGTPEDSVRGYYAEARQVLSALEALGVDYGEVTEKLENNGLAAFDASWRELGDQLRTVLRRRPDGEESGE
jgi:hypothetical protein